ncbi:MAG: hypothetical protein RM022_024385 [Nostoc sp. EfeVER01]|uniref:hypothetical protein n=1 Tax=unclassified Nostoc TaxID=2593658 RepID=UPI002AD2F3A2|nr:MULTISPECIES: hypothetical protein [unclassified Nostoc]MDZ7949210.1 hypothetical protein [Nostoc sp. EfeVER01]MDZ7994541.1 hypothetical protein [Nostoc sp. EspVER01]
MVNRRYYSTRTGKNSDAVRFDLPMLCRLFRDIYLEFKSNDYFQEAFGYECVDEGEVAGKLGGDIEAQMFRTLRKPNLWQIQDKCVNYSEDDFFDVIELLHDWISKPIDGFHHTYANCGWHYHTFDKKGGQKEFRDKINDIICDYKDGYELSENGEILELAEQGLDLLFEADLPSYDPENVEKRVETAILKFRRYRSSLNDRRDAIRDLVDVLEFLRTKIKQVITSKDEADLFNLANNFGVRHHNEQQKTDFDKGIWYSWMFYYYLATIHACLRLIEKTEAKNH